MKTTLWRGDIQGALAVCLDDGERRLLWRAPARPDQGVWFTDTASSPTAPDVDASSPAAPTAPTAHDAHGVMQECLLMRDGVHVVLRGGAMSHAYFNGLSTADYAAIVDALRAVCAHTPAVLEALDVPARRKR